MHIRTGKYRITFASDDRFITETGGMRGEELDEAFASYSGIYGDRVSSGVKWKRNGLRHSFGSYRMEQTKNEGQVALEMGNSPQVIKDHYFEIVDERATHEYCSIKPLGKHDRKIVAIA